VLGFLELAHGPMLYVGNCQSTSATSKVQGGFKILLKNFFFDVALRLREDTGKETFVSKL